MTIGIENENVKPLADFKPEHFVCCFCLTGGSQRREWVVFPTIQNIEIRMGNMLDYRDMALMCYAHKECYEKFKKEVEVAEKERNIQIIR